MGESMVDGKFDRVTVVTLGLGGLALFSSLQSHNTAVESSLHHADKALPEDFTCLRS